MKLVGDYRGSWAGRFARWAVGAAVLLACSGLVRLARAEGSPTSKKVAVGFSNLVARLDNDEIGFAKAEYRVHILEALRADGFNAVGAENLVFGKDESERADIVLGGTVKELACQRVQRRLRCRVGIEWQLLDRERDEVVYRLLARYAKLDLPSDNEAVAGKQLVLGALRSLTARARFQKLLNAERAALPDDASYAPATFARCEVPARILPADFDAIAAGTVVIKAGEGTGSGFSVSPDGLIITAAHVASAGKLEVHTRDGKTLPARVVRISRKQDVALLSLGPAVSGQACVPLEPSPQATGTEVYAIGSPGGEQLSFSLSRGIVSGLRTIVDVQLIQTDASLSPGNSGGPLLDGQGRVVGVVSRKIAGHAVEGLGFAIPIQAGLDALKLEPGSSTLPSLREAPAVTAAPRSKASVDDAPDNPVSLDPEGDRRRALTEDYARRLREQAAKTPSYVPVLRWGGLVVGCVSGVIATTTGLQSTDHMTRADYTSLRTNNDLAWAGTVVGIGAFTASYLLAPKLGPARVGRAPGWSVAGGPTELKLNVSFQ